MRLASFAHNGKDRIGFEIDGLLYDLNDALKAAGEDVSYSTMIE